jgi:hypothetical protein
MCHTLLYVYVQVPTRHDLSCWLNQPAGLPVPARHWLQHHLWPSGRLPGLLGRLLEVSLLFRIRIVGGLEAHEVSTSSHTDTLPQLTQV